MAERKVIHKWVWVWDFEKEERWLNEMAMSGWVLCGVGFCKYIFEKCDPAEYTVRLELRAGDSNYLDFINEIGAEYIGRVVAWIYLRKKTEDGPFDLYSDIDSRIDHLNRIGKMLGAIGFANLLIGVANIIGPNKAGFVNLICATLLMYAIGRIHGKKESLELDRMLRE